MRGKWPAIRCWGPAVLVVAVLIVSSAAEWPARLPFTVCVFRNVTGLPCPGCGMTRGFVAMGHGHLAEAWRFNMLAPALYVCAWGYLVYAFACGIRPSLSRLAFPRRLRNAVCAVVLAVVLAAWIVHLAEDISRPKTPAVSVRPEHAEEVADARHAATASTPSSADHSTR